jgi:alcohol dehydrogenase (cytochrome c)
MVALDAATGRAPWVTTLGDINLRETITMAPLAPKGKVYAGNSGGEMGVRGWLTAEKMRSRTPYPETLDYASRQTNLS